MASPTNDNTEMETMEQEEKALKLSRLVQALPQELENLIYEDVISSITFEPRKIRIDTTYKHPNILHLTKNLRDRYAKEYYSQNVFSFTDVQVCRKWFKALEKDHCMAVMNICYDTRLLAGAQSDAKQKIERATRSLLHKLSRDRTYWHSYRHPNAEWPDGWMPIRRRSLQSTWSEHTKKLIES